MKKPILIALMTVAVAAYKKDTAFDHFPPYRASHGYVTLREQHHPFREAAIKTQPYRSYRHRPDRQSPSSYPKSLSFRDQPLSKDYSSPRSGSYFAKDHPSILADETVLEDRENDRFSYRPSFRDDYRFADLYDTPIDPRKVSGQQRTESFDPDSEYSKHGEHSESFFAIPGKHGYGYISVPPISSSDNALPLNEETSTTVAPPMPPTITESTVSSTTRAVVQLRTPATSEPKVPSSKSSHAPTMPPAKSDTSIDAATTDASTPTVSTLPTSPVVAQQSTNLARSPPASTTEASLPVTSTESPLVSFGRYTIPPIEFQAAKFAASSPYYIPDGSKNELWHSLLGYPMSRQTKGVVKSNEQTLLPYQAYRDASNYGPDIIIGTSVPNRVLPEDSKGAPVNGLQSSVSNYLPQQQSGHSLHFQRPFLSETVNYVPLASLVERPRIALPSMPIASLPGVSRPWQTVKNLAPAMPRVSAFLGQAASASSVVPLGTTLSSGLTSGLADSHATSVFDGLSDGINGDISPAIATGSISSVPTDVSSFDFVQNMQRSGQLRHFAAAKSQPYSTGLQLHLGGFGGIDYSLLGANPVLRPAALDIEKLPRHRLATFSEFGFEQPA